MRIKIICNIKLTASKLHVYFFFNHLKCGKKSLTADKSFRHQGFMSEFLF